MEEQDFYQLYLVHQFIMVAVAVVHLMVVDII
jgi:hypothetical protein